MNYAFMSAYKNGTRLSLKVQPGASKSKIVGIHGEALKISLQAPPVDGKANAALIEFLASTLDMRKGDIELLSGETSRNKAVYLNGVALASAQEKFIEILEHA